MHAATHSTVTKERIENALASHYGRRYCVLTNRGTTALTAAMHALNRPGARCLFPAAMCSIPVFSALFAGWTPAFADVSLVDGNFDLNSLEHELKKGNVGAVVPVHMFGKPDQLFQLMDVAERHGASLIEDAALCMGAEYSGKPAGSFGRMSCLSFVRKMVPLEMGGAVMTDESSLADRARAFVESLPPEQQSRRHEVAAAMKAFHSLSGYVASGGWVRRDLFDPWGTEFHRLLLASTVESDWEGSIVLDELGKLPDVVQARRARAEVYDDVLDPSLAGAWDRSGSSLFAYPLRLKGFAVEDFLDFSSNQGYTFKRISYPVIAPVFGGLEHTPNAETVEREVIGLPLDDDQPVSSFWGLAVDFNAALSAYAKAVPRRRPVDLRGKLELRLGGLT